ncbi:MAG: DNA internalization-related competence protein ComEC/Rec2 [Deltaproteobacteria bacterium]|nr:DNA internalization-related competence protein ComEC/Rec2 [Deltaproteobacteria bacterium]MCL4873692.1 DNA internalization-related competence protein ComEC/Rec2 [bacterium]
MRPLVPVALSILSGIVVSDQLGFSYGPVLAGLSLSIIALVLAYAFRLGFSRLAVLPVFFFTGALLVLPHSSPEFPPGHILNRVQSEDTEAARIGHAIEGRVLEIELVGKRSRILVEVERYREGEEWEASGGKALLTVNGRTDLKPGDRVRTFAMLGEPRTFGNPGEFDYRRWLGKRGIFVTGFIKSERLIEITAESSGGPLNVHGMRDRIGRFIESSGLKHRDSLKALIISGQGGIDKELKDAFASTGTAHILSISGLHVGMVAAFCYGLFLLLMKRSETLLLAVPAKKAALALSAAPVIFYGMLAGFPVPTQRAVIMALAFLLSFALGRGKDYLNTLALAAIIVMALAPYSVWDASFQLSFAAMASIIILVPRMRSYLEGIGKKEKDEGQKTLKAHSIAFLKKRAAPLVLVTVAAGIGTSPVLAWHFNRVSIVGLAANLVVVPLSGIVVPSLFVSAALLPFSEALALIPLKIADLVFNIMAGAARIFSSIPYASSWVSPPPLHEIALFYALIICALRLEWRRARLPVIALAVLLLASYGARGFFNERAPGKLTVTFLSVGQGDASFIEFPDGATMLVDGGGLNNPDFDTGERVIAPFLRSKGIRNIDYMLLSHAQHDHMGGLPFIAENFRVNEFWWNGRGDLGRLGTVLEERGVQARVVNASTPEISVGGATVGILHPAEGMEGLDLNEASVIMKVSYGEESFLFTGDIGKSEPLLSGPALASTVLKVPHHGSRNSSSAGFLAAAAPEIAVVSTARLNSFGFPHKEALERYSALGVRVMRTDLGGAIVVTTGGKGVEARQYLTGSGP